MDENRDQEKHRYHLCFAGFGFLSLALMLACLAQLFTLPTVFLNGRIFIPWLNDPRVWFWIESPIVWTSLLGSYLLWGRWEEPTWQRRAGLLVVMCMVDAILWFLRYAGDFGLHVDDLGHRWFRSCLGQALGWAEFALLASLACGMMSHLGVSQAEEAGRSTRSLSMTGASLFMIIFCLRTDWVRGWPLEQRPVFSIALQLLMLAELMVQTITLIQVTALVFAAARQCSTVLKTIAIEDLEEDQWGRPADDGRFA